MRKIVLKIKMFLFRHHILIKYMKILFLLKFRKENTSFVLDFKTIIFFFFMKKPCISIVFVVLGINSFAYIVLSVVYQRPKYWAENEGFQFSVFSFWPSVLAAEFKG